MNSTPTTRRSFIATLATAALTTFLPTPATPLYGPGPVEIALWNTRPPLGLRDFIKQGLRCPT